jgi:hypothetical protein
VRERIKYRFRVPSAAVFTLYSYSKALEYRLQYATAASLIHIAGFVMCGKLGGSVKAVKIFQNGNVELLALVVNSQRACCIHHALYKAHSDRYQSRLLLCGVISFCFGLSFFLRDFWPVIGATQH